MPLFDGRFFQDINVRFRNFDNVTSMFNLSEFHKFILKDPYQKLWGKAQLLLQTEFHINAYEKLDQLLISEFNAIYNSAELHDMLNKQKLQETESLEHFQVMKQLCSHSNIQDSELMQYINNIRKPFFFRESILYGYLSIVEFKERLKFLIKFGMIIRTLYFLKF